MYRYIERLNLISMALSYHGTIFSKNYNNGHSPHYWPFVGKISRSPTASSHKQLVMCSFGFVVAVSQNEPLNKQLSWHWFGMPWRSCDITLLDYKKCKSWPLTRVFFVFFGKDPSTWLAFFYNPNSTMLIIWTANCYHMPHSSPNCSPCAGIEMTICIHWSPVVSWPCRIIIGHISPNLSPMHQQVGHAYLNKTCAYIWLGHDMFCITMDRYGT